MMKLLSLLVAGAGLISGIVILNFALFSALDQTPLRALIHDATRKLLVRQKPFPFYYAAVPLLVGGIALWTHIQL